MTFIEKKQENGYLYTVEDIFGDIKIISTNQISGSILDDIVCFLLKSKTNAQTIKGNVLIPDIGEINYSYTKRPIWDDNNNDICTNTSTLTKKTDKESTQTKNSSTKTWNWFRQFVEAFRSAWKKSKKIKK